MLRIAKVVGRSMAPELQPGDYAIFLSSSRLKRRQIVLVDHPTFGRIVKRVKRLGAHDLELEGLDPSSLRASAMGRVPRKRVRGRLLTVVRGRTDRQN